ncbi:MAG: hypothetical protein ACM3PF_06975 [Bacteroidota bacterium]
MKSGRIARSAAVLALGVATMAAAPAPKLKSVTIAIRNRVFHEFADQQTVGQGKSFVIGDTDYSARIVQFVPDFAMDLGTGKVISRSSEPKNPAFKVVVSQNGKPQDTTWAMMSLPPHFTRRSFLAFKVMRIDFMNHAPIVVDSVQAYKELEALKEQARKNARASGEDDPGPSGGMGFNPHGPGGPMPHGGAAGMNPHGAAPSGMNPHGTGASPHGGTPISPVPSHGSGGTDKTKDAK